MERQKTHNSQFNIEGENKVRGLTPSNLKIHYKATIIRTVWYWQKNRQKEQWNRMESPGIEHHENSQMIFDKGARAIQWSKDNLFNKYILKHWTSMCKNSDLTQTYIFYKTQNESRSKYEMQSSKTPRKDNIGENLGDLEYSNDCLDKTPQHNLWEKELITWMALYSSQIRT